ncbi:MAG: hypothetical protein GY710_22845 [Desulfobacteraceae bacterium]|nr:hypothetical protein [Desulfobacteraceae bacterium]
MQKARWVFFLISMILCCTSSLAFGNQKIHKLLIIDSQKAKLYRILREEMVRELKRLGYEDGKNLKITYYSLGHHEKKAINIWEIEKKNDHEVVFLNGTIAALAFKKLIYGDKNINAVFGNVTDPVGVGVIDDFINPPKANFTGICYPVKVNTRFRFIKKIFPEARNFGMVYADMPQSRSYRIWLEKMLKEPEFKDINIIFRTVAFVKGEGGHKRMALLAKKFIVELDKKVDVFVAPSDMMGAQEPFAKMVYTTASKPLVGIGKNEVTDNWGATISIFPSLILAGDTVARMIKDLFEGKSIKKIIPVWPKSQVAIDLKKAKKFKIKLTPEILELAKDNIVR